MLFEFEKHSVRISARAMAQRSLDERQRDVYDSHRHRVFSVSFYMTGNEIEAEDILRATFIRAFRRTEEPDHAMIDAALIEQLERRLALRDENLPVPQVNCGAGLGNILRTDLEEAIRSLPAAERLVFLLMDVEGYSAQRIGELLGRTDRDVQRAAIRARLRLRSELAGYRSGEQAA